MMLYFLFSYFEPTLTCNKVFLKYISLLQSSIVFLRLEIRIPHKWLMYTHILTMLELIWGNIIHLWSSLIIAHANTICVHLIIHGVMHIHIIINRSMILLLLHILIDMLLVIVAVKHIRHFYSSNYTIKTSKLLNYILYSIIYSFIDTVSLCIFHFWIVQRTFYRLEWSVYLYHCICHLAIHPHKQYRLLL